MIVEIQHDGKNFVVGIHFNPKRGNAEVSSIRGLYPKDNAEWLNWISQGKALYLDKEKIQALINQQRKNLAEVGYLDLNSVAKIVKNFENPQIPREEKSYRIDREKKKIENNGNGEVRFRGEEEPVFYSNAMRSVKNSKQERATPEQWLKMIEKNGGYKKSSPSRLGELFVFLVG